MTNQTPDTLTREQIVAALQDGARNGRETREHPLWEAPEWLSASQSGLWITEWYVSSGQLHAAHQATAWWLTAGRWTGAWTGGHLADTWSGRACPKWEQFDTETQQKAVALVDQALAQVEKEWAADVAAQVAEAKDLLAHLLETEQPPPVEPEEAAEPIVQRSPRADTASATPTSPPADEEPLEEWERLLMEQAQQ